MFANWPDRVGFGSFSGFPISGGNIFVNVKWNFKNSYLYNKLKMS
jgi:hypothetical protein